MLPCVNGNVIDRNIKGCLTSRLSLQPARGQEIEIRTRGIPQEGGLPLKILAVFS